MRKAFVGTVCVLASIRLMALETNGFFPVLQVGNTFYTNATLKSINPVEGVVIWPGGGAKIKLSDLAENVRTNFYDESLASGFIQNQDLEKSNRLAKAAAKSTAERAAFVHSHYALRVIDGILYDFTDLIVANYATGLRQRGKYCVAGNVIEVTSDGLLIDANALQRLLYPRFASDPDIVFVRNYPREDAVTDGSSIAILGIRYGRYEYTTTSGANATVEAYDFGRDFDPRKDKMRVKHWIGRDQKERIMDVSPGDLVEDPSDFHF